MYISASCGPTDQTAFVLHFYPFFSPDAAFGVEVSKRVLSVLLFSFFFLFPFLISITVIRSHSVKC